MTTPNSIPLIEVPGRLKALCGRGPGYPKVWTAAVSGDIPTHRVGSRIRVMADDMPVIARAFGLEVPEGATAGPSAAAQAA